MGRGEAMGITGKRKNPDRHRTCAVCGHEWVNGSEVEPLRCPSGACRSLRWKTGPLPKKKTGFQRKSRFHPGGTITTAENWPKKVDQLLQKMDTLEALLRQHMNQAHDVIPYPFTEETEK